MTSFTMKPGFVTSFTMKPGFVTSFAGFMNSSFTGSWTILVEAV